MTKKLGKWQKLALWCVVQNGEESNVRLSSTYQVGGKIYLRLDKNSHQKMVHKMMNDGIFIKESETSPLILNPEYADQAINFKESK